jgi:hypothetical protein
MEFCLTELKSDIIDVKSLQAMRASKEQWETFKRESTSQEFANMELLCKIFACREGIRDQGNYSLDILTETLKTSIPFSGLDSNDITWEILHAAWLTVQVCLSSLSSDLRFLDAFLVLCLEISREIIRC